jgi:dimethylsulfone monooxygenase
MSGDLARFTPERCIGASIDHISGGRWGINVVTGYAPSEARMFGGEPIEHDRRYEMAGEFTDILARLWGETKDLTPRGKFWSLEKAFITPKPRYGRPVLVNATGSRAGINYAGGAFRPRLHNQPGRPRDRRGACRSPRAQCRHKSCWSRRGRELRTSSAPSTYLAQRSIARSSPVRCAPGLSGQPEFGAS